MSGKRTGAVFIKSSGRKTMQKMDGGDFIVLMEMMLENVPRLGNGVTWQVLITAYI